MTGVAAVAPKSLPRARVASWVAVASLAGGILGWNSAAAGASAAGASDAARRTAAARLLELRAATSAAPRGVDTAAESDLVYALDPEARSALVVTPAGAPADGSALVPNDPSFPQQWALRNTGQTGGTPGADIDAVTAWDLETGSLDVVVAVLDTGLDLSHPDLTANLWTNPGEVAGNGLDDDGNGFIDDIQGWDFVHDDADPSDDNGHGTLLSGVLGAAANNGVGIAGICWRVRILPVKLLSAQGSGTTADAIAAVLYATAMGARVLLAGWGGGAYSPGLHDAIDLAAAAGIPFVTPAGGSSSNLDTSPQYPASYALANVVVVAATDARDLLASFSNWGPNTVDLAAPGVGILTTLSGGAYGVVSGTAPAAAHVAGGLGLLAAHFPLESGPVAIERLLAHVDSLPALAGRVQSGGRLDIAAPLVDSPTDSDEDSGFEPASGPASRQAARIWWSASKRDGVGIGVELRRRCEARLEIFDVRGRRLRSLAFGVLPPGIHARDWDGCDAAGRLAGSGIYLLRLSAGDATVVTRGVLRH